MTKKKTDNRRKVTPFMAMNMGRMLTAKKSPKSYKQVAEHFNVTPYTVRYNTDSEFRKSENKRVSELHQLANLSKKVAK